MDNSEWASEKDSVSKHESLMSKDSDGHHLDHVSLPSINDE